MENTPACIGIILDGNRRWARTHGMLVPEGHRAGYERLKDVLTWSREAGVAHVVAYAFSTENWQRPEEEVGALMTLFTFVLEHEIDALVRERVRVRIVGNRSRFSEKLQQLMARAEEATAESYGITLHLLLSYGGRAEIVAAAQALATAGVPITEESFAAQLWTGDMPDPDLVIRTGGEQRLSNFLPWQTVYSELFFTDTLWPDFSHEEFTGILESFSARERRHGK